MLCERCRHDNRPQAKFCEECAAPLVKACPGCGAQAAPTAKFCSECAHPLVTTASGEPRFATPEAYTPKHLAEKILGSRVALEGERKHVTVLFADLKGSMELVADRDPEEARRLLDPVLERMIEAIHCYEGTVNQVMGDGVMALFGAPIAHEDHAVRACYAALDMQAAIRRYAEEARRSHGVEPRIRIGLNSGEVVVRAIGSDLHMDYTAVGQTTHLAARMEQLAPPGSTRLASSTLRLAEGFVEVTPLGPVPVKGLDAPVEVYELVGAGPRRSRLQAIAAGGLTRFVGRETELEQLRRTLGRAASGHGQVVAIVGEAGVGKSRLVWEVTHSHRTHGWLVLEASSVSYGAATPYLPVIDFLKGYFQIETRDDARRIQEKVTGKLLTLDETLKSLVAPFLALLGVSIDDPEWQSLGPSQRRQHTLAAVKRLLLRESQVQPLLVVFEDLHWIDTETQAVLDSLVESLPAARLLLLVNYRPEYQHRWGSKTYYTQIPLDPLPPESAEILLDALLGPDLALAPLKPLLIGRTEGNPFFLEESVRTLVETGHLGGARGAHRLATPLTTVEVPATVQAILAARIDRLGPDDKAVLQTGSVIGKDVPLALLRAVSAQPEAELRARLGRLQAGEFLYETALFPDVEYTFKHALTHAVAYRSLLQERRCQLHTAVGDAIERVWPERTAELAELLADHFERGESWPRAATWALAAAEKAKARYAYPTAVRYAARAAGAAEREPARAEDQVRALVLSGDLASLQDDLDAANRSYDDALAIASPAQRRWIENKLHRRRTVVREGAELAFYEHGSGDETLLVMNPIVYGLAIFQPMLEILCGEFRIVTMDPRGTGASAPLPERYDHDDHAADVRAVIDAVGGPLTAIGISRGGNILVRLAVAAPDLFKKLVLLGTPLSAHRPIARSAPQSIIFSEADTRFRELLAQGEFARAIPHFVATIITEPGTQDLAEQMVRNVQRLPERTIQRFLSPDPTSDITKHAGRVRVPTLVLHGTEDRRVAQASSQFLAEKIPGAELYLFEGRGHLPSFTATREFCEVLRRFVRTGRAR